MHVVVGELVPKGLALSYSERIALGVSVPVRAFFFVFAPLIWVLQRSSEGAQRLIGIDPDYTDGEAHSEAELKMLLEVSTQRGRDRAGRARDALQGLRLRRQGGVGRDGAAARGGRHLGRDGARGGAARRARVALHALPGLPRVARRDRRDPPRARPRLGAARQRHRRGRARGAPAPRLRRARDEGSRRAARRVPAHEPAHVGRRRRVRRDAGDRHARGPARGDRRRDRGRVRPSRRVDRAGQRDDDPDRRHVPDRRLQRGARDDARARGLPHRRRLRLRPDRPRGRAG